MKPLRSPLSIVSRLLLAAFLLTSCAPAAQVLPTSTPLPTPASTPVPFPIPTQVPTPAEDLPVLVYSRSGGIAGFCDQVTLYASGRALVTSCRSTAPREVTLSASQTARLAAWQAGLAGFQYDHSDGAVADGMTLHLEFTGRGPSPAAAADQAAILSFASEVTLSPGLVP